MVVLDRLKDHLQNYQQCFRILSSVGNLYRSTAAVTICTLLHWKITSYSERHLKATPVLRRLIGWPIKVHTSAILPTSLSQTLVVLILLFHSTHIFTYQHHSGLRNTLADTHSDRSVHLRSRDSFQPDICGRHRGWRVLRLAGPASSQAWLCTAGGCARNPPCARWYIPSGNILEKEGKWDIDRRRSQWILWLVFLSRQHRNS